MIKKLSSFLTDNRLPIYAPLNYINSDTDLQCIKTIDNEKTEIDVAITMDIEHDYGSGGNGEIRFISQFLERVKPIFSKYEVRPTYFVQGNLVNAYFGYLKKLDGELGLHGWAHEPWGESWFVKDKLPSVSERRDLLKLALEAFENNGFKRPTSFRAPNMVVDSDSLRMLADNGFNIDSSHHSYRGGQLVPHYRDSLFEIPVSFDVKPHFGRFFVARYAAFNMANIVTGDFSGGFSSALDRVVKIQRFKGLRPLVVLMCHPWEFFESYNDKFNYCSSHNFAVLEHEIQKMKERYDVRFLTLMEILRR